MLLQVRNSDFYKTLKHFQNYFIAQLVTTGLTFLSIPIFTRLFTQEDYGIVAVYNSYLAIVIIILSANSAAAVSRYYFEEKLDFDEFLGSVLVFTGIIFSLNTLLFLIFYEQIASIMKMPDVLPFLLIFSSLFTIISTVYFQLIQAQKKSSESAIISSLKGIFSLVFAIILVFLLQENRFLGRIWAYLIISFLFSLFFLYKILSHSKITLKKKHIWYVLTYAIPLIPYALSSTILAFFDRIMINDIYDAAAAGVYSLGYNIALLLALAISATQTASNPYFFEFLNKKQYLRLDLLIKRLFSIITILALVLILFAEELVGIIADAKFQEGFKVIPIIVLGYIFFGMFTIYGRYIGYAKKTIYSSINMTLSGAFNLVLNAILIPRYGYIAAAYTTVASYFLLFLLTWLCSKFILKQRLIPLRKIWVPTIILFCTITLFLGIASFITNFILLILLKLLFIGIYTLVTFYHEIKQLVFMKQ